MNASMQSTDIYYVTPERIALHKRDFDRASEARSDRSKKQTGRRGRSPTLSLNGVRGCRRARANVLKEFMNQSQRAQS